MSFTRSISGYACKAVVLAALVVAGHIAGAQTIVTVAGTGTGGFSGDGSAATAAKISGPVGMAIDKHGNLYIADHNNYCIRMVNTAGIISTVAGVPGSPAYSGDGGPATAAKFMDAGIIVFDTAGNMYVCDVAAQCVRKINTAGTITTVAGTGTAGYNGDGIIATTALLSSPGGIAVDEAGDLYISDQANHRVREVNSAGIINTIAGTGVIGYSGDGGLAIDAKFRSPGSLALDAAGNLYVADDANNVVRVISPAGMINAFAGNGFGAGTGAGGYTGDYGPATAAELNACFFVAVGNCGNVFITDAHNYVVREVNTEGIITTISGTGTSAYGGDNGPASAAGFVLPDGLITDTADNIYISDLSNARVRKIIAATLPLPAITGATQVCHGDTATLADADTSGGIWQSGATSIATIGSATGLLTGVSGGTAVISYSALNNWCQRVTATDTVTVSVPMSGITGRDTICRGDTLTLGSNVTGGVWNSANTAIATITGTGRVTAIAAGTDSIRYIATNACGTDTAFLRIVIPSGPCRTGLNNIAAPAIASLQIYPNPAAGSFSITVSSPTAETVPVVLTDMLGKKILERSMITNNETEIQVALPAGMYFISAMVNGEKIAGKVVIE